MTWIRNDDARVDQNDFISGIVPFFNRFLSLRIIPFESSHTYSIHCIRFFLFSSFFFFALFSTFGQKSILCYPKSIENKYIYLFLYA